MINSSTVTAAAVMMCVCASPAMAAATFAYEGVVEVCDDTALGGGICDESLFIGDLIGGMVMLEANNGLIDQLFTANDVLDYVVGVGDNGSGLGATPQNSTLADGAFLQTNDQGLITEGFVSILVDPALLPIAINVNVSSGTWEILLFPGALDLLLVGGSGGFNSPAAVPLPGALWLFWPALMALFGTRRGST